MNILITGGAGFIGTHTARALLKKGHRVRVLDIFDTQVHGAKPLSLLKDKNIEYVKGDIRRAKDVSAALVGMDVVYHFAALTGVGQSMFEVRRYTDTNVAGTANLIDCLMTTKKKISKLILASSRAVYGEGTALCPNCGVVYPESRKREDLLGGQFQPLCPTCDHPVKPTRTKENRPLKPISIYGWSKKEQEELCRFFGSASSVPVVVLRYFNVYGQGQSLKNPYTGILSIFHSRLKAGHPISVYEQGLPVRDFVHVADVVRANLLALSTKLPPFSIFNVGRGEGISIINLVRLFHKVLGRKENWADRGEFRLGDIFACAADLTISRKTLGFRPRISLRSGLTEFVSWAAKTPSEDRYEQTVSELENKGFFGRAWRKIE